MNAKDLQKLTNQELAELYAFYAKRGNYKKVAEIEWEFGRRANS